MSPVTVRAADHLDLPMLRQVIRDRNDVEQVDFSDGITFIAEYDGKPYALVSARLVWQVEPLMVFDENVARHAKRRGLLMIYQALEEYIQKSESGVKRLFCHIVKKAPMSWVRKLGMQDMFSGGRWFAKTLH